MMLDNDSIIATMDSWIAGRESVLPLSTILTEWGNDFEMYRNAWARHGIGSRWLSQDLSGDHSLSLSLLRDRWIGRFGFAIPCAELIDSLRELAPIVEIGAGRSGYMSALMLVNGVDVVSTDAFEGGQRGGSEAPGNFVRPLSMQGKTAVRRFPERNVFCSWPTFDHTWFRQALRAMRIGRRIVVIMEDSCAEQTARDCLDRCFVEERTIEIPAFPNMNDIAIQYRKVRGC